MKTDYASQNTRLFQPMTHRGTRTLCPLCRGLGSAEVATHLASEEEGVGERTFVMIKALHAQWLEESGLCASCWSFYRNLVHVLDVSGSFDARFRPNRRSRTLTAI